MQTKLIEGKDMEVRERGQKELRAQGGSGDEEDGGG